VRSVHQQSMICSYAGVQINYYSLLTYGEECNINQNYHKLKEKSL